MSELENNLIEKVKILILYGNRPVVFAENTSVPDYKSGIFFLPKEFSDKQKESL